MSAQIKMVFTTLLLAGLVTAGCSQEPKSATGRVVKIQLTSAAFADGQPIPAKYTGDALDISPPLAWTNAPAGVKSFALIADDPDAPAGTWTHWVIYDLPPTATTLAEDTLKVAQLRNGAKQGLNSFQKNRLQRADAAARQGAPLLFQTLRAGQADRSRIRSDQGGFAQGDGRPRARRRPADGNVSKAIMGDTKPPTTCFHAQRRIYCNVESQEKAKTLGFHKIMPRYL